MTAEELVDVAALTIWIERRLGASEASVEVERMGEETGAGNALFWVNRGDHTWVLRRPPAQINAPGASDMVREWRILEALVDSPVPHPTPVAMCEDASVIGAPFLIMEKVDGFTPVGALPAQFHNRDTLHRLSMSMVDALAEMAGLDWKARGLAGLGKPKGFLERQVSRWMGQLDLYRVRDIPKLDDVAHWLEHNRPTMSPAALMHGDYSPYNVMASHKQPGELAAVIDWDTGTIGDPLLDIGHLLARWSEPGEEPVLGHAIQPLDGLATRSEMARRYEERTGRDLSALAYYQALSLFKLAIILEGRYARRFRAGVPESENSGPVIDGLIASAAEFASGKRV